MPSRQSGSRLGKQAVARAIDYARAMVVGSGSGTSPSPIAPRAPQGRSIARRVAIGFGAVLVVALLMSATLLFTLQQVSTLVAGMQEEEQPIRRGYQLSAAVREQALHVSHTLIGKDDSHLARYHEWHDRLQGHLQYLQHHVPATEVPRLEQLGETTASIHHLFISEALPAVRQGDGLGAQQAHRRLDHLTQRAAESADRLAVAIEGQMAHSHHLATRSTRIGILAGVGGLSVIFVLSVVHTLRLRGSLIEPLRVLGGAAERFGAGEFSHRVPDLDGQELSSLGHTMNQMAAELAQRQQRLVKSERMAALGQLAAGVAHELNNPIGIMRGYLKTMSPNDDPKQLTDELAILDEEARHCQKVAEDLVSYSRVDQLTLEPIAIHQLIENVAQRVAESEDRADDLTLELEAAEAEVDRTKVRQVVMNLVLNAFQISSPGSRVTLNGTQRDESYRLQVRDQGPGFQESDQDRIFEPFFTQRQGGSGLGLSVAQGIVQAHGGSISAKNAPGGALFSVHFPLKPPSQSERLDDAG